MSVEPQVAQGGDPAPAARPPRPGGARPLVVQALVLAVAGVVVGLLWAAVTPTVRGWSAGIEQSISGEVAFSGLAVIAGVVVGVIGAGRPGRRPVAGVLVRLVGSGIAALIAWGVGQAVGAPVLAATGVLVFWPLVAALVTALITLVQVLLVGDGAPRH